MITQDQIFSEVKNSLRNYDEYDLIDDTSLRDWMTSEIKRFGTNVMIWTEEVLDIKNNKAELPNDFWQLTEAWMIQPQHYCAKKERIPIDTLREFHQRNIEQCCDCHTKKMISKKYINGASAYYVYYSNPTLLKLGKSFDKRAVGRDCINLPNRIKNQNYNVINILGNTLQTEFETGNVYIKYRALPTDEEGEIAIPETQHNRLYEYILRYLEYKVMRDVMLNNDDRNVVTKIQMLRQEKDEALALAMTESKAGILSPKSWKSVRNNNRKRKNNITGRIPKLNF